MNIIEYLEEKIKIIDDPEADFLDVIDQKGLQHALDWKIWTFYTEIQFLSEYRNILASVKFWSSEGDDILLKLENYKKLRTEDILRHAPRFSSTSIISNMISVVQNEALCNFHKQFGPMDQILQFVERG